MRAPPETGRAPASRCSPRASRNNQLIRDTTMSEITTTVYETFKHRAVTDIIRTMVNHQEPDAYAEYANRRVDESFQDGTLAGFAPTSVVEAADTTGFSLGNWFQNGVGEGPVGGSMRHIANSAVSHDLREAVRQRRDVIERAIHVTERLEALQSGFVNDNIQYSYPEAVVTSVFDFAAHEHDVTEEQHTHPFSREDFGPHHVIGVEPIPVFDDLGIEEDTEPEPAAILQVLEAWFEEKHPEVYNGKHPAQVA